MLIKETKIASGETNTRAEVQPKRRADVDVGRRQRVANGDGHHAENLLRHYRGCDHRRVFGVCAQFNAAGRGRRAVGNRKGRSRRYAAAGRRLLGTAVALYGSLLPARYAQSGGSGPRSQVRSDEPFAPPAGYIGCRLALARTPL